MSSDQTEEELDVGGGRKMECVVCSEEFRKLKLLQCGHSFCSSCLERVERGGRIRCPYCRQQTDLTAFGVGDLPGQFAGTLRCSECNRKVEMKETLWCSDCKYLLCSDCYPEKHEGHESEPANNLGPVKFCIDQLDRFSAIHTRLTLIQKCLVREYLTQLGDELERDLDADLNVRIERLKTEKRHLKSVFDIETSGPSASNITSLGGKIPSSFRYASIVNEIYKMSPTSQQKWMDLGSIPKEGMVFSPPKLEQTKEMFLKQDNFTKFSASYSQLLKPGSGRVPSNYIGAGLLEDPVDLCSLPKNDILVVTCKLRGLFCFKFSSGELLCNIQPKGHDQFTGVAYDATHKLYLVSVLRGYCNWVIQLYDQRMKLRQEVQCPKEPPYISNRSYRWLTSIRDGRVVMTCGDESASAVWLFNLNANRWKLLISKTGVNYRRATFNPPRGRSKMAGVLYIPEMIGKTVTTYTLDTETWELNNFSNIHTEEFTQEQPVCVQISADRLIVGNWETGNIIVADLRKCSSQVLTSVGPQELVGFDVINHKQLAVICGRKEMVEVYRLNPIDTQTSIIP